VCPARPKRAPGAPNTAYSRQIMSQNHRRAAPAIDPTKKSSLFEVPYNIYNQSQVVTPQHQVSTASSPALSAVELIFASSAEGPCHIYRNECWTGG
jgi:hypothetical protein